MIGFMIFALTFWYMIMKIKLQDNYQMHMTINLIIMNLKLLLSFIASFIVCIYIRFDSARTRMDLAKALVIVFMVFTIQVVQDRLHDMKTRDFILTEKHNHTGYLTFLLILLCGSGFLFYCMYVTASYSEIAT